MAIEEGSQSTSVLERNFRHFPSPIGRKQQLPALRYSTKQKVNPYKAFTNSAIKGMSKFKDGNKQGRSNIFD